MHPQLNSKLQGYGYKLSPRSARMGKREIRLVQR